MLINLLPHQPSILDKYKIDLLVCVVAVVMPVIAIFFLKMTIASDQEDVRKKIENYKQEIASYHHVMQADKSDQKENDYRVYLQTTEKIWLSLGGLDQHACLEEISRLKNKLIIVAKSPSIVDMQVTGDLLLATELFASVSISKIEHADSMYSYRAHAIEKRVLPG